uniref:Uncharacterized protein n=1 Tax=Arion vulgaris TaxID=1028688 RepID=A0A0B6Y6K4_9EUPU
MFCCQCGTSMDQQTPLLLPLKTTCHHNRCVNPSVKMGYAHIKTIIDYSYTSYTEVATVDSYRQLISLYGLMSTVN